MGNMEISATEFAKNFGRYREIVQRETVAITSHERITGYFVSPTEYEEYRRLKRREATAFAVEELSEETIRALAAVKMHPKHAKLNKLLNG